MPKKCVPIDLTDGERERLAQWIRAGSTPQQVALRARIVLSASDPKQDREIAFELGVHRHSVALWRKRVHELGIGCIWEISAGRGRKVTYGAEKVTQIIDETLHTLPAGCTHWSTRTLAKKQNVSKSTIQRVWQESELKPHLQKTFKLSRDPKFLEKLTDVVGLYLTPPQNAVVLCVDEKSQIQALDRTQPGLPLKKGRCGTITHDYKRHGTTSLFAALHVLEGKIIGECYSKHRHQEFLRFLRRLDSEFPSGLSLHLILDNYATHKHPKVQTWLAKHPRFVLHFIPTSSSWLNLVEQWFRALTQKTRSVSLSRASGGIYRRIYDSLECLPKTLCVGRYSSVHDGKDHQKSPPTRGTPTRINPTPGELISIVICGTHH